MGNWSNPYLIRMQYLGFRYSGWQVQPNQRTIEGMLSKTLKFVLPNEPFKILGSGRTDAKVSALDMAFELFLEHPVPDVPMLLYLFNQNLPPDIRVLSVEPVPKAFNVIKNVKCKEYVYLFSFGEKNHPYCAPFLANIQDDLNLDLMKKAAVIFEGEHNFSNYTVRDKGNSGTERKILSCALNENLMLTANFFPTKSYALHVEGVGFLRYQIRMIMGALIQVGRGELTLSDIEESLKNDSDIQIAYIAPGSGLHLRHLKFDFHDKIGMGSITKPTEM